MSTHYYYYYYRLHHHRNYYASDYCYQLLQLRRTPLSEINGNTEYNKQKKAAPCRLCRLLPVRQPFRPQAFARAKRRRQQQPVRRLGRLAVPAAPLETRQLTRTLYETRRHLRANVLSRASGNNPFEGGVGVGGTK